MRNLDPTKWISRGSLVFPSCSRETPPKRFTAIFGAALIKVATRAINTQSKSVKTNWKYSGRLFAANPRGEEFSSKAIRINTTQQIFWEGEQSQTYNLAFQPHHWLPNCRITIWEYQWPIDDPPKPGDVKRYNLRNGQSSEIAPGLWRTIYLLATGLGQRSFAVIEAYLVNPNGEDEAIDVDTKRVGLDYLQITLLTPTRPVENSVEILVAVASN